MKKRYRQIQIRTMDEPVSQPLKWMLATVAFVLALSVTFAEVGGDGVGNPYNGGHIDNAALEEIFVVPEHQDQNSEKVPILLKRR
jgi:hypothetical protein